MFAQKAAKAFNSKQSRDGGGCVRLRVIEAMNVAGDVSGLNHVAALSVRVEVLRPSGRFGVRNQRTLALESNAISTQNVVAGAAGQSGRGSRVVWNEETDIRPLPNGEWPLVAVTVLGHTSASNHSSTQSNMTSDVRRISGTLPAQARAERGFMSRLLSGISSSGEVGRLASVVLDCNVERLKEASPLPVEQWHYMLRVAQRNTDREQASSDDTAENGELRVSMTWLPSAADSHLADRELSDRITSLCGTPLYLKPTESVLSGADSLSSSESEDSTDDEVDCPSVSLATSSSDSPLFQSQRRNYACMGDDSYYESSEQGSRGLTGSAELSLLSSLNRSLASERDSRDLHDQQARDGHPATLHGYDETLTSMSTTTGLGASGKFVVDQVDDGYVSDNSDSERATNRLPPARSSDVSRVSVRGVVSASGRSFNDRFQSATERLFRLRGLSFQVDDSTSRMTALKETKSVNLELMQLYQDFLMVSQIYGRIIISEVSLPTHEKTIKPIEGQVGTLGGQKFLIQGVLFKFASDRYNLFSGDMEAAAKIAGHELKGLSAFYSCNVPGLCVPLCALIDFLGFRLVALAELPIKASETLISGSANGGQRVQSLRAAEHVLEGIRSQQHGRNIPSSSEIAARLGRVCSMLNIQPHRVQNMDRKRERRKWKGTTVFGPADLEVHIGFDRRLYCLDFSRLFPPEKPNPRVRSSHLFRLLRPEHCKRYPVPLCSDAYSAFIQGHPKVKEYNEAVDMASAQLRQVDLPQFIHGGLVPRISVAQREGIPLHEIRVDALLHAGGVNLRNIGLVIHTLLGHAAGQSFPLFHSNKSGRSDEPGVSTANESLENTPIARSRSSSRGSRGSIETELEDSTTLVAGNRHMVRDAVVLVAIEAIARTVKEIWRGKMRVLSLQLRGPRSSPFVALTSKLLNRLFATSQHSERFWGKLIQAVEEKFEFSLPILVRVFDPDRAEGSAGEDDTLAARRFLSNVSHFSFSDGRLLLLHRLLELTGIRLRSHLLKLLHRNPTIMDFRSEIVAYEDVKELAPRTKRMAIVSRAQGFMSLSHGLQEGSVKAYEEAIKHLEEALRTQPNDYETLCLLAQTLFRLEVQRATERKLRQLQERPPGELPSTNSLHLDTAFIYSSNIERANHLFLRAIEVDPGNSESCMQYAYFLSRCNQQEKALEYHLLAVQQNPSHVGALEGLQQLLNRTNRHELAAMISHRRTLQRVENEKQSE